MGCEKGELDMFSHRRMMGCGSLDVDRDVRERAGAEI